MTTPCWIWPGPKTGDGYGTTRALGHKMLAHRVVLILLGFNVAGKVVCHSCDNSSCVNPAHLKLGTQLDNMRDASSKGRLHHQKKTHCKNGHLLDERNVYRPRPNWRVCRKCQRAGVDRYQKRQRANK